LQLGLIAITVLNLLLTILRDVKGQLRRGDTAGGKNLLLSRPFFTQMETIAAVAVLALLLLMTGF